LIAQGRYRNLTLAASAILWAASQVFPDYTAPLTHRLFLNPFAWQLLFAIGVTLGIQRECDRPILPYPSRVRWLVVSAWAIVIGAFLYRILAAHSGFDI